MTGNGAAPARVRVVVADDRPLVRAALVAALDAEPELAVVGEASSREEAVAVVAGCLPHVVLVRDDLSGGGVDTCTALKEAAVPARVAILGARGDREMLLAAIEAGADGYITMDEGLAEVADAVQHLAAGEALIPPGMLGVLLRDLIRRRREEAAAIERVSRLSARERQVLALVAEGLDHEAIAAALVLSPHTARTHIRNVLEKLGVHSRLEAAALAHRCNLLERAAVAEERR